MNKMKKLFIAAAMTLSAPLFAADYSVSELAASEGHAVVRVTQILANCERGEARVLFNDQAGALIKVADLANIDELLNARGIAMKGRYGNLHVVLADEAFLSQGGKTEAISLQSGLNGTMLRLNGELQVTRNFVGADYGLGLERLSDTLAAVERDADNA